MKVRKIIVMEVNMKDIFKMAKNMDKVALSGKTEQNIQEILKKIKFRDMEFTNEMMEKDTKDLEKIIKWMVKDF